MKKLLIVGKDSYIGTHFKSWMAQYKDEYQVDELSVLDDSWMEFSFAGYDSVLHVAGIAHRKETPELESLYYKVNRDLAVAVAAKAKEANVRHFVFMSSMSVYGFNRKQQSNAMITASTPTVPQSFYGKSKLEAEVAIRAMGDDCFRVSTVRPPMVYGAGCKGNFPKLVNFAKKCPAFPDICNERSMIFIDNLCEFLKLMIAGEKDGLFFPQNAQFVKTKEIVVNVRHLLGKRTCLISFFNPLIRAISARLELVNKVLGDCVYAAELSDIGENYQVVGFEESIRLCVMNRGSEINLNKQNSADKQGG